MPPNTCSDAKKTRKQKHQTGNHLRSNNDALYNLELLRFHGRWPNRPNRHERALHGGTTGATK